MNNIKVSFFLFLLMAPFHLVRGQEITLPPNGDNQKAEISQWIGLVKVTISYSSPDVNGPKHDNSRKGHIWGELVPYGFTDGGYGPSTSIPWRAGANENTTITFSHDIKIGGKEMKAGTYGLFLKIEKDGPWTWIFCKDSNSWGSFLYDPKEDVLRVDAMPEDSPYTEFLTYGFDKRLINSAIAFLQWENKKITMPIEVPDYKELYVSKIREELRGWAGFTNQNWIIAANWCVNNNVNLEEALEWVNKSLATPFRGATIGVQNFTSFRTKAKILIALGRKAEADSVMETAIRHKATTQQDIFLYAKAMLDAGEKEKALEFFKFNRQRFPDDKFITCWGLALGYTAAGNKKMAIENWELTIKNVPDDFKSKLPGFQHELIKLKE